MKVLIKIYKGSKIELNIMVNNHGLTLLIDPLYVRPKFYFMENIVTYKIKYTCGEESTHKIKDYLRKYNNLLRCTYNYMFEGHTTTKEIWKFQKELNNVVTECGLKNGVIYDCKTLLNQQKQSFTRLNNKRKQNKLFQRQKLRKICFGGKNLYKKYNSNLITKDQLKELRYFPICSIGEAQYSSNRHFTLHDTQVIFKPNKNTVIELNLKFSKNYKKDIEKLITLQNNKQIPITYKLDLNYVYITFDLNKIREVKQYKFMENRVFGIDLNPNYIGYSIVDWKNENKYKIINSAAISIKDLNDYDNSLKGKGLSSQSKERKYITNKRNYETCQIAKFLIEKAKHYKCEIFAIENLNIESKDTNKSRKINRLINNQWNRNRLIGQIQKRCKLNNIKFEQVNPEYSSFVGNIIFRNENLPDMCLSSLEIGRRAYEFVNQYKKKKKEIKKNIIIPDEILFQNQITQALEEIGYIGKNVGLRKLYYLIKNMKLKYRVPLILKKGMVYSMLSKNSYFDLYKFERNYT